MKLFNYLRYRWNLWLYGSIKNNDKEEFIGLWRLEKRFPFLSKRYIFNPEEEIGGIILGSIDTFKKRVINRKIIQLRTAIKKKDTVSISHLLQFDVPIGKFDYPTQTVPARKLRYKTPNPLIVLSAACHYIGKAHREGETLYLVGEWHTHVVAGADGKVDLFPSSYDRASIADKLRQQITEQPNPHEKSAWYNPLLWFSLFFWFLYIVCSICICAFWSVVYRCNLFRPLSISGYYKLRIQDNTNGVDHIFGKWENLKIG